METAADITTQVVTVLDAIGVEYEIIECDPDFADTAAFCEKYGYPVDNCGNAIVVASKREPVQFATCIVKGTSRLDVNKTVRKHMASRRRLLAVLRLLGFQLRVQDGCDLVLARRSVSCHGLLVDLLFRIAHLQLVLIVLLFLRWWWHLCV